MPRSLLLLLTGVACFWCCLLLVVRFRLAGNFNYLFMPWNLFLALVPLGLSLGLRATAKLRHAVPLLAVWLLFFPNAPYVLTDLIHLKARSHSQVSLWLDLLMLLSFALVSLWLGFQSLRLVQQWFDQRWSRTAGWLMTIGVLTLSGFGVYLGRFLRWNSWDLLRRPHLLFGDICERLFNPLQHSQTWSFTAGYGIMLILAYLLWTTAASPPNLQTRQAAT